MAACNHIASPIGSGARSARYSYHLQSRVSELFAVDIHPEAMIGAGVFIDHAHGIVIGETAVVEDDVSMFHSVTLGGTGKDGATVIRKSVAAC